MTNAYVLLINPDLSSALPVAFVAGQSGRKYARSSFQRGLQKHGIKGVSYGHVARMTVEEYEASAVDISLMANRRGNRWIAKFIGAQEAEDQEKGIERVPVTTELIEALRQTFGGKSTQETLHAAFAAAHEARSKGLTTTEPQAATGADEAHALVEPGSTPGPATNPATLPEVNHKTQFFALKAIAKAEGVSLEGLVTNAERLQAILKARQARGLVMVD